MSCYLTTRDVARMLGVAVGTLGKAVWEGRIEAPVRGPGRCYLWTIGDIENASFVLRGRSANDVLPTDEGRNR